MRKFEVQIRAATAADAALLAEIGAQAFYDFFAADNTAENMAAYLAASFSPEIQAAELAEPGTLFFIAEVGGVVAGYAKLRSGAPPAEVTGAVPIELERIYALKGWAGQGVGPALMQVCIEKASGMGCKTMWLGVWEHNPRAQAFYRKWGFTVVGTHIFQLGNDRQTDLLMQRLL